MRNPKFTIVGVPTPDYLKLKDLKEKTGSSIKFLLHEALVSYFKKPTKGKK
jgi:hypothetical protein